MRKCTQFKNYHVIITFYLQELRLDRMDHFFSSVASLMSTLLRSCVEKSISDLLDLLEEYGDGNAYDGRYTSLSDLALPQLKHPLKIFLVSQTSAQDLPGESNTRSRSSWWVKHPLKIFLVSQIPTQDLPGESNTRSRSSWWVKHPLNIFMVSQSPTQDILGEHKMRKLILVSIQPTQDLLCGSKIYSISSWWVKQSLTVFLVNRTPI